MMQYFKNKNILKNKLTYFDKICPAVACSQTGMSGGHVEPGPAGMPELQGLPESLAWRAPSSGQTKCTKRFPTDILRCLEQEAGQGLL